MKNITPKNVRVKLPAIAQHPKPAARAQIEAKALPPTPPSPPKPKASGAPSRPAGRDRAEYMRGYMKRKRAKRRDIVAKD